MTTETEQLTPDEKEYLARLITAVLDTVIDANPADPGNSGIVDPEIVRLALADVAAAVDFNCGLGRLPSERRKTGEAMGRRYAAALKAFIDGGVEQGWPLAQRIDRDGPVN